MCAHIYAPKWGDQRCFPQLHPSLFFSVCSRDLPVFTSQASGPHTHTLSWLFIWFLGPKPKSSCDKHFYGAISPASKVFCLLTFQPNQDTLLPSSGRYYYKYQIYGARDTNRTTIGSYDPIRQCITYPTLHYKSCDHHNIV